MQQIRVYYINAMGPTVKNKVGGIFISQRIKALRENGVLVEAVSYEQRYTNFVRFILEKKGIPDIGEAVEEQVGVHYKIVKAVFNFYDMVLARYRPELYKNKLYKIFKADIQETGKIDLVHIHWMWPVGFGFLKLYQKDNIPYVITCHGSEIAVGLIKSKNRNAMLEVLENATVVEFVSNALMQTAISVGYSGKNGVVIYNGINTDVFFDRHLGKTKRVVGFVGNLIPIKGADRLPAIFGNIYEKYSHEIEFVVVGKGLLREQIEMQMSMLPVRFTGQLSAEELAAEYSKMAVLIVPSRSEGYPCVIKEAQACGVIPVGNNVGGIKEAIGEYGVVINSESEEDLVLKIGDAVEKIIEGAIQINVEEMTKDAERCSWENRQKESMELYQNILERSQITNAQVSNNNP